MQPTTIYKITKPLKQLPKLLNLQNLVFKPVSHHFTECLDGHFVFDTPKPQTTHGFFQRFNPKLRLKNWLKIFGILSFILPLSYFASDMRQAIFTPVEETVSVNKDLPMILQDKKMTVATVADNSLYFGQDGYEHGFGVDVMRGYASHLGVDLTTLVVADEQEAMTAVATGQADLALTNVNVSQEVVQLNHVSLSCGQDYLSAHGLNQQMSLQIPKSSVDLTKSANDFLCDSNVVTTNQHLAQFYNQDVFQNDYSEQKFNKIMKASLPIYQSAFKHNAKQHDLDWELLVAMGYQESQLNPEAVSPTGVKGIMMLTNDTATAMGVTDRVNPVQSIQGGAKYFNIIKQMFGNVPESDRIWFSLASYNMGPQAIKNIQAKLSADGKNGNSWAEVYRYLVENQSSNSRYTQCIHYVTNIRGFLETLKQESKNSSEALVAQKIA